MDHMEKYLETSGYLFVECMSFYVFCKAMHKMANTRAKRAFPRGDEYDSDDDENSFRSRYDQIQTLTEEYMGELKIIVDVNYNHIINDILPRVKFYSDNDQNDVTRQKVKLILSYIRLNASVKWPDWNEKDFMINDLRCLLRV